MLEQRTKMSELQLAASRKCKQCKSEKPEIHKHQRSPSGFGSGLSAPTSHTVIMMAMTGTNTGSQHKSTKPDASNCQSPTVCHWGTSLEWRNLLGCLSVHPVDPWHSESVQNLSALSASGWTPLFEGTQMTQMDSTGPRWSQGVPSFTRRSLHEASCGAVEGRPSNWALQQTILPEETKAVARSEPSEYSFLFIQRKR